MLAFDRETCPAGWSAYAPAAGRTIIGVNEAGANELAARARGENLGEEQHTLSVAQLPAHDHDLEIRSGVGPFDNGDTGLIANGGSPVAAYFGSEQTSSVGDGQPFTNFQPSVVLLYCVKE